MIRRMLYRSRQRVRTWTRQALDALDPPVESASAPVAQQVTVEETPNPFATRYGLSRPLGLVDGHTPLGRALLSIDGVSSVYGTGDFVTITRTDDADAERVRREVVDLLRR